MAIWVVGIKPGPLKEQSVVLSAEPLFYSKMIYPYTHIHTLITYIVLAEDLSSMPSNFLKQFSIIQEEERSWPLGRSDYGQSFLTPTVSDKLPRQCL